MENCYYTIFEKSYPHDIDLSEEENCFIFDTEEQAKKCLNDIFNDKDYYIGKTKGKFDNSYLWILE